MSSQLTPRSSWSGVVALLVAAMVAATYLTGGLSVLSSYVIEELDISRSQLGLVFATVSFSGAISSPFLGRAADRSVHAVLIGLFVVAGAAVVVASLASSLPILLISSVLAGLALGAGNPATNRIVSEEVPLARRGLMVGLKQSGPPLTFLAAGLILPSLAEALGWRLALVATVLLPIFGLGLTRRLVPKPDRDRSRSQEQRPLTMPQSIYWLTAVGFAVALALSAVIAFLPLYAQEDIGVPATTAGLIAAAMGLVGVIARVLWGALGDRIGHPSRALLVISVIGILAAGAIRLATVGGEPFLWIGGLLAGASVFAWHSVAWIVIIGSSRHSGVGSASGVMQLGTSVGFALGPPTVGLLVDASSSYDLAWTLVGILMISVTALTFLARNLLVPESVGSD